MSNANSTRVTIRLKNDIYEAIKDRSAQAGVDPSNWMQRVLEHSVLGDLPPERQKQIQNEEQLYEETKKLARKLYREGRFDEHFTLTVFRELVSDPTLRALYETVTGAGAYTDGVPGKSPTNMYLGYFIKNAIAAEPLCDAAGKPRRAFVNGEPIKSYTLLVLPH